MKLEKAIENNEEHAKAHRYDTYPDYYNAIKLGIEALKLVEKRRRFAVPDRADLLPGETFG